MNTRWNQVKQPWTALDNPKLDRRKAEDCVICDGTGLCTTCRGAKCMDCDYRGTCRHCRGTGKQR